MAIFAPQHQSTISERHDNNNIYTGQLNHDESQNKHDKAMHKDKMQQITSLTGRCHVSCLLGFQHLPECCRIQFLASLPHCISSLFSFLLNSPVPSFSLVIDVVSSSWYLARFLQADEREQRAPDEEASDRRAPDPRERVPLGPLYRLLLLPAQALCSRRLAQLPLPLDTALYARLKICLLSQTTVCG